MTPTWPTDWRYIAWSIGGWLMFLAALVAILAYRPVLPVPALWGLAALPAITVGFQFVMAYRLIAAQDEYMRALTARRTIAAAGFAITMATAWSVGEMVGLPHLPAWLIYPLFWGLFGVITPFIERTAR